MRNPCCEIGFHRIRRCLINYICHLLAAEISVMIPLQILLSGEMFTFTVNSLSLIRVSAATLKYEVKVI